MTEQAIGLLGSTARIPESGKYIQSQDIAKIDCNESLLDKDFAFYLISSAFVKQQLSAAAQQTKIRHTSPDKIKECTVWIPSLDIQKRIGRILTDIDNKIAINRQINDNLRASRVQNQTQFEVCRGAAVNADVSPNLPWLDRSLRGARVRLAA